MTTYSISLNDELADLVEHEIKSRKFANRSEFFRDLVRTKFLSSENTSSIEEIPVYSEDYKLIQEREKNAELVDFNDILEEHNV
jgi:metal-responsive CopG/Arc/MetJ family transcriptional regulator